MAQGVFGIALEPPEAHAAEVELLGGLHVALPEAPSGNLAETTRPSLANPCPSTEDQFAQRGVRDLSSALSGACGASAGPVSGRCYAAAQRSP